MRALVSVIALLALLSVYAQATKPLLEAIEGYESDSELTFSYDAELLSLADDNKLFTGNNLDRFIEEVEAALPLEIVLIDSTYYTISAKPATYRLVAKDSLNGAEITESFGLQVVVNDAPIPIRYTDGYWEFSYSPDVDHRVKVFSQGYQTMLITVKQLFNQQSLEVRLGLPTTRLGTVIVEDYLTKGINLRPSQQHIQVNVTDLPLLPGETDGDIFTSIAALPGVTNPDGRPGNLFIRGSETDQTLIYYDNIPIYHRGHYYGTISPYNPKIIKDVEVYRSGFHPRFGDRVGGAIIINSDDVSPTSSNYGLGANTLFGMGYGKVRFGEKWSGSFGIRNSYPRSVESPKLEAISESVFAATALAGPNGQLTEKVEVLFRDYNGKLNFQPNNKNHISLSALYTFSDIYYRPPNPPDQPRRMIDNRFDNVGVNLTWDANWNNGWRSSFSTSYSAYDYQFDIDVLAPNHPPIFSDNNIDDLNLIQEFSKTGELSSLQFGIDYKWQTIEVGYQNIQRDSSIYRIERSDAPHTLSSFFNYEFFGWQKWYLQAGFRGTYFSELNDYSISPRMLVNYDLGHWVTLKGSVGWYNQFLSQVKNLEFTGGGFDNELWTIANGESGFIIRGTQSMVGGVINIKNWILDVEAFHKTANNLTVYEDRVFNPRSSYFTMDQETFGVDLLVKKQLADDASVWVGYSFHDSEIRLDTTDQVTYQSKFVQPHVWYVGGALKKNRWKLSAGWKYASGLNAQSLDIAFAEVIFDRGMPPPGAPPRPNPFVDVPERYPNVHSLDISASYKIPPSGQRKWSASFGLSLLNALNQENLSDRVFRSREGFVNRNAIGFAPNLMVLVEW